MSICIHESYFHSRCMIHPHQCHYHHHWLVASHMGHKSLSHISICLFSDASFHCRCKYSSNLISSHQLINCLPMGLSYEKFSGQSLFFYHLSFTWVSDHCHFLILIAFLIQSSTVIPNTHLSIPTWTILSFHSGGLVKSLMHNIKKKRSNLLKPFALSTMADSPSI